MCDYENNIFIFTNETKNGKEEANIYQGYNQFLTELLRRTGCSLFNISDFRKKINRFLKMLNYLVSIEKNKLLNAYYQTKLDYYNSLKLNLNSFKKHGYQTFITKPYKFEILFIEGSTSKEIIEEIFNTPKLKVEFLMLLHIEKMEIDIEERKIDEDDPINMPPDAVWKEIFIWSDRKEIQQVQNIEQALEHGKAGYYIAGYEIEHCNSDKSIFICGTGKTVKEVCEDLMGDFLFCPDQSYETAQQLNDFLRYVGGGFEFYLYPASEELVMLYESARFYELYNSGNHITMMDTNINVECFFDGKLAQPYFIK